MKQSPELTKVQEKMQPGKIVIDGMLGDDTRPLVDIITEDRGVVNGLGLTHEEIADFLDDMVEQGKAGLGDPVRVGDFTVQVEHYRGRIPCPWADGVFPKVLMRLVHGPSGKRLLVSALGLHMIREHGFYQGSGSDYRVDPKIVALMMGL